MDKSLLSRATNTDDSPTPGYLYGEISRMTLHSYETCQKVMDWLVTRVQKKHHNTKFKTLQVIKHVCREGRQDFRREIQRHIPVIKECLQYRGPPDPLKGDEYYRRVRESAKECLEAIFEQGSQQGTHSGISSRIQGVGNPQQQVLGQNANSSWTSKFGWGGSSSQSNDPSNVPTGYPRGEHGYGVPQVPMTGGYPDGQHQGVGGYEGPPGPGGYAGPTGYHPNAPNPPAPAYGGTYGNQPPQAQQQQQPSYPSMGPGPGAAKFSGIGNPMYGDPRQDEKKGFFNGLKEKAEKHFAKQPDLTPKFAGPPPGSHHAPDGWNFATNRGPTAGNYQVGELGSGLSQGYVNPLNPAQQDPTEILKKKSYDGNRKKGSVGGAWGSAPENEFSKPHATHGQNHPSYDPEPVQQSQYTPQQPLQYPPQQQPQYDQHQPPGQQRRGSYQRQESYNSQHHEPQVGTTSGAQPGGDYERQLILSLCPPAGMRAVPAKDRLDAFLKQALTLDAEVVGLVLEETLDEDHPWQVKSKVLAVIESLLKADGHEAFVDYFRENSSTIQDRTEDEKTAVRDRATKVLSILGDVQQQSSASAVPRRPSSSSSHRGPQAPALDLLGGFDDPDTTTAPAQQQQQYPQHSPVGSAAASGMSQTNDMFGGLQLSGTTASPAPAVPDVFGGLQMSRENAPLSPAPDMFGGSGESAAPPTPTRDVFADPLLDPVPFQVHGLSMNFQQPPPPQTSFPAQAQTFPVYHQQQQQPMAQLNSNDFGPRSLNRQISMGPSMTPNQIVKTIQEPVADATPGFDFMHNGNRDKRNDSFSFVQDEMKHFKK